MEKNCYRCRVTAKFDIPVWGARQLYINNQCELRKTCKVGEARQVQPSYPEALNDVFIGTSRITCGARNHELGTIDYSFITAGRIYTVRERNSNTDTLVSLIIYGKTVLVGS